MIDRMLVVDDEFLIRQFLEETISRQGIDVTCAGSGEEAIELLAGDEFQMVFSDLKMGKASGIDVLKHCRQHCPNTLFVIMTAYGTIETAVEAMRLGAFDFLLKPFAPDQADILIEKGRQWFQLNERNHYLEKELSGGGSSSGGGKRIIGSCEGMQKMMRLIQRVAPTDATVLVTGESGTGKELVASEIHRLSDPSGNCPYVRMNCAAVPEALLESELFGHEKGAFTGATERRIGRFELADGGTLLLDEIGEISLNMQAKLLRVLQESEFERVGGNKTLHVNTRVIATTNRDLKQEVQANNFREDLYYRLNVFPIHLPPLRQRQQDIEEIAKAFLRRQQQKLRRNLEFTADALACLCRYSWPGNIRELENVVERVAILEDGPLISAGAFPPEIVQPPANRGGSASLAPDCLNLHSIERSTVLRALNRTGGNRSQAADLLGFSVRTLRNKINEYKAGDCSEEELAVFNGTEA